MPPADVEFLTALLRSPTAWRSAGLFALLALAGTLALAAIAARWRPLRALRSLAADSSGAAGAVDFTLTFPMFLIILMFVLEFAAIANNAILVHYAAFAAARSARVTAWYWLDEEAAIARLARPIPSWSNERAEAAARFALIAASPADRDGEIPRSASPEVDAALRHLLAAAGNGGAYAARHAALRRKAAYAFHDANVEVEIGFPFLPPGSNPFTPGPVSATVRFWSHLELPATKFALAHRTIGAHGFRMLDAEVTLQ